MRNIALLCVLSLAIAVAFTAVLDWSGLAGKSKLLFYIYSPPLLFAALVSGNLHNVSSPLVYVGVVVENFVIVFAVANTIIRIRRWKRKKRNSS